MMDDLRNSINASSEIDDLRSRLTQLQGKIRKMYNKEDLKEAFKQSRQAKIFEKDMPPVYKDFDEWFEHFEKK